MRSWLFICLTALLMCSCAVPQTTEMSKFTTEMNLLKTHHPELYDEYMKGGLVVEEVYEENLYGEKAVCVSYHKVQFVSSQSR